MTTQTVEHIKFFSGVLLLVVVLSFVNLYPHWHAWKHTPESFVFSGQASWFDPWDINVYVSAVRWGQAHGFLMENVYTSQSNQAIIYYPVYTFAGMLWKNTDPFLIFHGITVISTLILGGTVSLLVKQIFRGTFKTLYISLTILLAGGLGFLVYPAVASIDMSMTAVSFQSAIQRPHEGFAIASYFVALLGSYYALTRKKFIFEVISSLMLAVTLFLYPYYILSFFAIILIFVLWKYDNKEWLQHWRFAISLVTVAIVTVGIIWLNLQSNPTFSSVVNQHLSSPSFIPFASAYGVLLLFFGYQLVAMRPLNRLRAFLVVWVCVSILFALLPVGIARFYLRGMFFPLIVLAFMSLEHLVKKYFSAQYSRVYAMLAASLSLLLIATSVSIFFERLGAIDDQNPWYYHSSDQAAAFSKLQQSAAGLRVLSGYHTGNVLPALSDTRVYVGHLIQTPNAEEKLAALDDFYSLQLATPAAEFFLMENNLDLVYWGEEESLYVNSSSEIELITDHYPFLTLWYENNSVRIFQADF